MAGVFAGVVAGGIKSLFTLGSQAEETANKFNTVFGSMSADVDKFIKTFGLMGGLTDEQGQAMVATTGQIAQGLGFAQAASAGFSKQILQLAVDMGSFNNAPTRDVLDAINSGLTGIIVPLKQYGIVLRANDIAEKAMAQTGKTSEKQLTQQEKATAALVLITEKAGVAVGDMARTQYSTANSARRLGAEIGNVKESLGKILVAAFNLSGGFTTVEEKVKNFGEALEKNKDSLAAWGNFTIKMVGLIISSFKNLIKVAFNVGKNIGLSLKFLAEAGSVDLTEKGAFGKIKALWDQQQALVKENVQSIKDAADEVAQALVDLAVAGEQAVNMKPGALGSGPKTRLPKLPARVPDEVDASGKTKKDVDDLTTAADTLTKAFDLGMMSAEEFSKKAGVLGDKIAELGSSSRVSADQVVVLGQAWTDLNKAITEAPGKTQVADLTKEAETLQSKFKLGLVSVTEFVTSWQTLLPALMALRDSEKLTDEQLLAVQQSIRDINDVASEIPPLEIFGPEQVGFVHDLGVELKGMFGEAESFSKMMADVGAQFLRDFGGAIEDSMAAWVSGSKSAGQAFKESMLGAIAAVARSQGQFYLAKAMGAFGEGFLGNPAAFVSAAKFTAAAALMFAVAGGIGGLGHKGGGAGGGSAGATAQANKLSETKGDATLIIEGGGMLDMNDPRTEASFIKAMESLTGRRVTVRKTT